MTGEIESPNTSSPHPLSAPSLTFGPGTISSLPNLSHQFHSQVLLCVPRTSKRQNVHPQAWYSSHRRRHRKAPRQLHPPQCERQSKNKKEKHYHHQAHLFRSTSKASVKTAIVPPTPRSFPPSFPLTFTSHSQISHSQKRYKKIITTYDVSTPVGSGSGSGRDPSTTPSQKAGNKGQKGGAVSASAGPSASKKRKHQQFDEGSDEEEEQVEQKVKVKAEPATADDGGDVNFDDFVEDFTVCSSPPFVAFLMDVMTDCIPGLRFPEQS